MNPVYDYKGQVALVTGASAGIGLATAKAFAQAGAAVVLVDVNEKALETATEELTAAGYQVLALICDVSVESNVIAMIEKVIAKYGRLDMAFNNAGISGPSGSLFDETEEGFDQVNAVNLKGTWACMKHELKQMSIQGSGAIVNCSSMGGLVGLQGRTAYHGTKHGVLGLTKSAGLEFATAGIRVNAVCPGVIDTPMLASLKRSSPEAMTNVVREQPIGRLGLPEEIAAAVLWLCSPAASFVVGTALSVDGGFTAK